jgi:hypothetical protein
MSQEGMLDEAEFFRTKKPWQSEAERDYFGVPALRTKLSALQVRTHGV